jgi:hypothetical protein
MDTLLGGEGGRNAVPIRSPAAAQCNRSIQKAENGNFLCALAETVLRIIMDADVEALISAGRHERTAFKGADATGAVKRSNRGRPRLHGPPGTQQRHGICAVIPQLKGRPG